MRPVAVINSMKSHRPTGIGIAGEVLASLLPAGVGLISSRLDHWFAAINDGPLPGVVRALLRLGLAQMAPLLFPSTTRLLFTSHHAPLWRTGRHMVVLYDTIPLQFPNQAPMQSRYFRRALPRVLCCAERVVTISAAVRDEFVALGYPLVSEAIVIPAWSAGAEMQQLIPIPRARHELLVVGARYPHKNIDVVLLALEQLNRATLAPWRLTLAGVNRRLWAKAWGGLQYFERLGWVRVIDRVGTAELAALYARSTALVYPSLAEGQGLPPLEAMAAGCPVICSDLPVLRETCGDAALYFPATDAAALAAVLEEEIDHVLPDHRGRRAEAARGRLAVFGREAIAARWHEFLDGWP